MSREHHKHYRKLLIFVFCLSLSITSILGLLLLTPVGLSLSATLIERNAPGVSVSGLHGSWTGDIEIDSIAWHPGRQKLTLHNTRFKIGIDCLFTLQICINPLTIESVHLLRPNSNDAFDGPSALIDSLPTLRTPLPVIVKQFEIKAFHLTKQDVNTVTTVVTHSDANTANRVRAKQISWWGHTLRVKNADARYEHFHLTLEGKLDMSKEYPLDIALGVNNTQSNLRGQISTSGSLKKLSWQMQTEQPAISVGHGSARIIGANPIVRAEISINQTVEFRIGQKPLSLESPSLTLLLSLNAKDSSDLHYKVDANVPSIISDKGLWSKMAISATGNLKASRLTVDSLNVHQASQHLQVKGSVSVQTPYDWDISLSGSGWNLTPWDADLPSSLTLTFNSQGSYTDRLQRVSFSEIHASDETAANVLSLNGGIFYDALAPSFDFRGLDVQIGDNKIRLAGSYPGGQLSISGQFENLSQIPTLNKLQQLSGKLVANIEVHSDRQAKFTVSINAESTDLLVNKDWSIPEATLTLDGSFLAPAPRNLLIDEFVHLQADLGIRQLSYRQKELGNIAVNTGYKDHRGTLDSTWSYGQQGKVKFSCASNSLSTAHFNGQCATLVADTIIDGTSLQWHLERPIDIEWRDRSVAVQPFCLAKNSSQLCSLTPILLKENLFENLNIKASSLDWSLLSSFVPQAISPRGTFSAEFSIPKTRLDDIESLTMSIESHAAQWIWHVDAQSDVPLVVEQLQGKLRLAQGSVTGRFDINTTLFGNLSLNILRSQDQNTASFTLNEVDLSLVNAAYPLASDLRGQLTANIDFDLAAPRQTLSGLATVKNAYVDTAWLPTPISRINIQSTIQAGSMTLAGNYVIGGGIGDLSGKIHLADDPWSGAILLDAKDVTFEPNHTSWARLNPKIDLYLHPQQIKIEGAVKVIEAKIKYKALPENAIDVSPDARILHSSNTQPDQWPVLFDIDVDLDKASHFAGFGLDTQLRGKLKLWQGSSGEKIKGKGIVSLHEGQYRAYGQDLQITEGKLVFAGPLDNPDVYIQTLRNNTPPAVKVGVTFTGELKDPSITLHSQPIMSEEFKIHYLITGEPPSDEPLDKKSLAQQSALSLGLSLSEERVGKIAEKFGIEELRVGTNKGQNGQEIQISGKVAKDLSVRYGKGLFDDSSSVTARYKLHRRFFVELMRSDASAVDLLWLISGAE